MKKIKQKNLEPNEFYLLYCPGWSESEYDIIHFYDQEVISSNGSVIPEGYIKEFYLLPL